MSARIKISSRLFELSSAYVGTQDARCMLISDAHGSVGSVFQRTSSFNAIFVA